MSKTGIPLQMYSVSMKKYIVVILAIILVNQSSSAFVAGEGYITPTKCPRPFVAAFLGLDGTPLTARIHADFIVRADGRIDGIKLAPLVGEGADIKRLSTKIARQVKRSLVKWQYAPADKARSVTAVFHVSNEWQQRPDDCRALTLYDFSIMSEIEMRTFQDMWARKK